MPAGDAEHPVHIPRPQACRNERAGADHVDLPHPGPTVAGPGSPLSGAQTRHDRFRPPMNGDSPPAPLPCPSGAVSVARAEGTRARLDVSSRRLAPHRGRRGGRQEGERTVAVADENASTRPTGGRGVAHGPVPRPLFLVLYGYPYAERWITGPLPEQHLCDRPRNQPTRTALGVAAVCGCAARSAGGTSGNGWSCPPPTRSGAASRSCGPPRGRRRRPTTVE